MEKNRDITYPGGVESNHQLARVEGVGDLLDQLHEVINQPVRLKADKAEVSFRGDVNSSVVSQTSSTVLLDNIRVMSVFYKNNSYIVEDGVHGVPAGFKETRINLHPRHEFVYPRFLKII